MTDEAILENVEESEVNEAPEKSEVKEKMIPASRVEELVKKAKLKGRDAMQEEFEKMRQENEALRSAQNQAQNSGGSMGGMALPFDQDAMRKQVMQDVMSSFEKQKEEQNQAQLQQEAEKLASDYYSKMQNGKGQFDDFEDVMSDFNPAAFPQLVYLANNTDNTAAVMYELQKNPSKLATMVLMAERDPRAAQSMIAKLSASIKSNEQARSNERDVNAPLSRMQSSPTGQDSGTLSISDMKKMFRG